MMIRPLDAVVAESTMARPRRAIDMTSRAPCDERLGVSAAPRFESTRRLTLARNVALPGHFDILDFDDPLTGAVGIVGIWLEVALRRVRVEVARENARI